jgi:Niemann-Pick C1 protein
VPYFDALDKYFEVGPPVYFVVQGGDVSERSVQQQLCSGFSTCSQKSVVNLLEAERKRPEVSFINLPSASWIDDFLNWLNPEFEDCCKVRVANPKVFCGPRDRRCQPCFQDRQPPWNVTMDGFPEGGEFMSYLQQWLRSPTTEDCPLAGQASYGAALALSDNGEHLDASHFRTYNVPLKSQADFIHAFQAAQRVAEEIREHTNQKVFPYSPFFVFFDQYDHIIGIAQQVLGLGLGSTLIVTSLLLGSWRTGLIVTGVVGLTVLSVMGMMVIEGVMLNALSLVNLVISLGIAVEFSAHIARAFMGAGPGSSGDHPAGQKERDERVWIALADVGPSVSYSNCRRERSLKCIPGPFRDYFHEINRNGGASIYEITPFGGMLTPFRM